MHSLTKYVGGHGNAWWRDCRLRQILYGQSTKIAFPVFNQPEPSYHGVVYTEAFGDAAFIAVVLERFHYEIQAQ
ncbi:hypothetical protein O9929_02090 [Vibrio lentus]|nr:hypothetical protein [Vibrio lentus]